MTHLTEPAATRIGTAKVVKAAAAITAIVAFIAGPLLFVPPSDMPTPSSAQMPLFIALAAAEAAVLGAAIVFAVLGRPAMRRLFSTPRRAAVVHAATAWALGSWWLHDNLHIANGTNLNGLLAIEYVFHVTVIAAVAAVAWVLLAESRGRRA